MNENEVNKNNIFAQIKYEGELVEDGYLDAKKAGEVLIGIDETLFPELIHDLFVELEGHITRGNENSNTIGFMYEGHILTCYPSSGNIKDFKSTLFTNCTLRGYVDRLHKKTGEFIEKRPRIKFVEIISNESDENQKKLF